jgi:23S rRNA (cytidine1920-2'-O)/16S rRNA (cytidine1409-2'-O)-methyltransferase
LRQVLPAVERLLTPDGEAVVLIKPQFEAGREKVKKGVVRDPDVWRGVLHATLASADNGGWAVLGLERSPIRGPAGNVEFLAYLSRAKRESIDLESAVKRVLNGG